MTTADSRVELLYGTLDLLILRTLVYGPSHGHAIARHIQSVSENALQIETGSLYPALHRLEGRGWIAAEWKKSDKGAACKTLGVARLGAQVLLVNIVFAWIPTENAGREDRRRPKRRKSGSSRVSPPGVGDTGW